MSLNPHSAALLIRAEVMPESENQGDLYERRMREIQSALDAQIKQLGLASLSDDEGFNVVDFRSDSADVALTDSPTGQIVNMLFAQFFVLFRTASRAEVAEKMTTFEPRGVGGDLLPGIAWQFFDPEEFMSEAPMSAGN
ncbi:hypothetical protein [Gordonia sihwensis]|uniref:hypothetical protein n=1 Tax=Gordonia sihwensis TaxID=173559 RepID=UPI003D97B355